MKRILLTGGGGAIGIHILVYFLENTDWHITVLDSFRHKGMPSRIQSVYDQKPQWRKRITVLKHDLCCPISPELADAIGPVDHILHLAALSDVFFSIENPIYTMKNNLDSTMVLLEYARHTPHETFVYFSTDEVYGPVEPGEAHPEWASHRPSNPYSASKAASEDLCYAYWRAGWVNLIVTNTMNNFGETQAPSKFPAMVREHILNGDPIDIHVMNGEIGTRFYIHSRDTADAVLFILKTMPPHPHVVGALDDPDRYHIMGECLSNLELAEIIAELMGVELTPNFIDFHSKNPAHDIHYGLEDNKLRAAGWVPPLGLKNGLARTIERGDNPC